MQDSETNPGSLTRAPSSLRSLGSVYEGKLRPLRMVWRVLLVRLRFFMVIGVAFAVVANWDFLQDHWQKLMPSNLSGARRTTRNQPTPSTWCPMCPGVLSEWPNKCPVCNMGLVRRRRGEMIPAADGGLARMQLSPYRVQLAGVRTVPVEYRQLKHEVVTGGIVRGQPPRGRHAGGEGASPTRVWVQADVFERDLPLLEVGQRVEVYCEDTTGATSLSGRVLELVAPPVPSTSSCQVLLEIDNFRSELRAGMFVTARIQVQPERLKWFAQALAEKWRDRTVRDLVARTLASPPRVGLVTWLELPWIAGSWAQPERGRVLAVPETAVIDTGLTRVVYRELGPGLFEAVEVKVGPSCSGFRPVLEGLEVNQRVVAAGAFLVDAETRLNPSVAAAYFGAAPAVVPDQTLSTDPEVAESLGGLDPANRILAARQKTCPVTGKVLGSMGTPVQVTLAGKSIFLCCQGCESELRAKAGPIFSKLPAH